MGALLAGLWGLIEPVAVPLFYGLGVIGACAMAALSHNRLVMWAALVLAVDYLGTKIVLQFQPYPQALWAWPALNIFGSFSILSLRLRENRPSLTAVAGLYLIRAGWLDMRYALGGDAYSYVLGTNLVWTLQLLIIAGEGRDAAADLVGRWGSGLRLRVFRPAGAARVRPQA